jgi:transcriptional regulator with XRE-family HTH domain
MRSMPIKIKRKKINAVMEQIGERIARLRKARGMTQAELAKQIEVSQNLVSGYEVGTVRLSADIAIKVAKALKVSTDELLGVKNGQENEALPSRRILRRLARFDSLPKRKQDALLQTIDAVLKSAET